ncbi:hypothetical protein [Thermodesulfatator autotrophicus]|uniref:Uncharacterized protein n=1 Tax=Thermodesulfatator autotrophicus TaxID=1795632 RepID=A0A177EAI7_9BACT|nr:hypothetical protein [Thermodesulfatator autotrophicus]OAG28212.1 hypothetical protein TH606_02885 [Thermodesulfatator autotrophicus]
MKFSLSRIFKRDNLSLSRFLWWAGPILLALLVLSLFTWPAWENYRLKKELYQEKLELLVRYQKKISRDKPRLEKELAKTKDLENKIFIGLDPYVIVSELEKEIGQISGLKLRTFRIIKRENISEQIQKVKVLLTLDGDIKGMVEFLEKLSQTNKALRVSRLTIISRRYFKDYVLSVNMELEALYSSNSFEDISSKARTARVEKK